MLRKLLMIATMASTGACSMHDSASEPLNAAVPYCFGRFLLDIPTGSRASWGSTMISLSIQVEPGRAGDLEGRVREARGIREEKLSGRGPVGTKTFQEVRIGKVLDIQHVLSDELSGVKTRIESFGRIGDALLTMNAMPSADDTGGTIDELEAMALRTRLRRDDEVPSEPGHCIGHAIVLDDPAATENDPVHDWVDVGFRLANHPDVHLSISVQPPNDMRNLSPTLDQQMAKTRTLAARMMRQDPFAKVRMIRQGSRDIGIWKGAYEILMRLPPSEDAPQGSHEFMLRYTGHENQRLHPHVEIRMDTGLADAGSHRRGKPSLTDAQAYALWKQLLGTIRPRPVAAPVR